MIVTPPDVPHGIFVTVSVCKVTFEENTSRIGKENESSQTSLRCEVNVPQKCEMEINYLNEVDRCRERVDVMETRRRC